jgi:hypothetical protein
MKKLYLGDILKPRFETKLDVDTTNNTAKRGLRHNVVARKIS